MILMNNADDKELRNLKFQVGSDSNQQSSGLLNNKGETDRKYPVLTEFEWNQGHAIKFYTSHTHLELKAKTATSKVDPKTLTFWFYSSNINCRQSDPIKALKNLIFGWNSTKMNLNMAVKFNWKELRILNLN